MNGSATFSSRPWSLALAGVLLPLLCGITFASTDGAAGSELLADSVAAAMPDLAFFRDESAERGPRTRRELVGLVVNGREHADGLAMLVFPDGRRLLPLRELARALSIELIEERDALVLDTPIGRARFLPRELDRRAEEYFAAISVLAERLAAEMEFDEAEYAVRIRLPWNPRARPGISAEAPIRPDTSAPGATLSRLRGELLVENDRLGTRESGFLESSGRLGAGTWQGRFRRDPSGENRLQDYHWMIRGGEWAGLVGHQIVGAHPLLTGFDLTGVQVAWSDRADRLLAPLDPGRLVTDRIGPLRTLRGEGPPGGVAELVIDGLAVARLRIPLDGRFEFLDVPVAPGHVRIEVAVYAPFALGAPQEVLDFSGRASDRLMPEGATLVYAGAGREGNPFDGMVPERGAAGFVTARRGFTGRFTLEAAAQRAEAGDQSVLGVAADLGPVGVASAAFARADGATASLLTLDGDRGRAFWRVSLRDQDTGFRNELDFEIRDRYAEAGWRQWPRWELSLVARERTGPGEDVSFVKPAARLRPVNGLVLQSRPDSLGDYVHDVTWQVRRDTRLSARQDRAFRQLGADHRWSQQWSTSAALTESRDSGRRRGSVLVSWQESDPFGWYADVGVLSGEGDTGFLLRAGRELRPGLRLRLEARKDPLFEGLFNERGTVARVALSFDFGRAGRGFTRAGSTRAGQGGVGGRIAATEGSTGLGGVAIRVNGQVRTRTDDNGRFSVANLGPGVYRVDLDDEGLPLELSAEDTGFWVEVAEGSITPVDFKVVLRLGAAGQLLGTDGAPADGGRVQVVDDEGRVRARATATAFGYYRVDGLPPGAYRILWLDDGDALIGERSLVLTDTFVFSEDIQATKPRTDSSDHARSAEDDK